MNNQEQITAWFRQYGDDVYNFLIYYTGTMDVEDLVQEVFMKAIRKSNSFRYDSSPKSWLFSIARNVAIDASRKRKRERKKETKLFLEPNQEYYPPPQKIYQQRETNKELYDAILLLKKNYKDVILLRGIHECSVAETAEILNWSENKVNVTFHRAMKSLEKRLGSEFYE
ncbi:RNA polymerase sigma-70 factor (ECF subfamily) [Evansella vedderi]|uniref:RNA polymerase sigma factor n=1 Tax=Evansella vedderi TaxID=38282 RepID=A0ABU0A2M8_9BACI|nr:RNA polymerase sigma factor [Evansella vedderi]MDQ0257749.1 RNA polymerase sigma-70 factor (ECF subfamily) [Evansella vedderi]